MSLLEGATIRVRMDSELSVEFEVNVGMDQGSVLSHFLQWWWMLSLNLPEKVC